MKKPSTVIYDGQCPICRLSVEYAQTNLNSGQDISFIPYQSIRKDCFIPSSQLQEKIHAIDPSGKIMSDIEAVRLILQQGKRKHKVLARLLGMPGIHFIAKKIYFRIARNRKLLSKLIK